MGKQSPSRQSGIALPDREANVPVQQFVADPARDWAKPEDTEERNVVLHRQRCRQMCRSVGPEAVGDQGLGEIPPLELAEGAGSPSGEIEKSRRKIHKEKVEGILLGSHNRLLSEALKLVPTSE